MDSNEYSKRVSFSRSSGRLHSVPRSNYLCMPLVRQKSSDQLVQNVTPATEAQEAELDRGAVLSRMDPAAPKCHKLSSAIETIKLAIFWEEKSEFEKCQDAS